MLDRLAIVGDTGMGALTYKPEMKLEDRQEMKNLELLLREILLQHMMEVEIRSVL